MGMFTDKQLLMLGGAGLAAAWLFWDWAKVKLNPADQNNVVNTAVNDWYDGGSDGVGTLGTDFYEWMNYGQFDENGNYIGDRSYFEDAADTTSEAASSAASAANPAFGLFGVSLAISDWIWGSNE